jgi:TonB family protein
VYPVAAVESRVSGKITVEVHVSENGGVTSATVVEGPPLLRQASLEAAHLWRFSAQPISESARLTFSFRLMPKNTPEAQLVAVFRPPHTVEVRKPEAERITHYARLPDEASGEAIDRTR